MFVQVSTMPRQAGGRTDRGLRLVLQCGAETKHLPGCRRIESSLEKRTGLQPIARLPGRQKGAATMPLDVDFARAQYPVFAEAELADWAFFENAGGSYVPRQVSERLDRFYRYCKVQPYGPFEPSIVAGEAMDESYRCVADLLRAKDEELTLGPSTTLNCYVLAQAIRPMLRPGDEVVITNQDHEANIGCWERLGETGAVIRQWSINAATGELSLTDLESLVTDRTRLICFSLCSNIVGSFQDVAAIAGIARGVGAITVADGVSYAPHRIVDVNELGVDVYVFSTYKTFGTHVGVMWIRETLFDRLVCQGHYFNHDSPRYRMNPTGPQHAQIAALAGLGHYLDALYEHHFDDATADPWLRAHRVFALIADHETALANQLLDVLRTIEGVRIIGHTTATPALRAPTISFVTSKMPVGELARQLARDRIAVRSGDFYARRCIEALGLERPMEGVLRVSMVHYNTPEEVRRLTERLVALIG